MDGDVSVDEAISRGRKMITYPMIALFLAVPGLAFYLCDQYGYPQWTIGLGLLIGAILSVGYSFFCGEQMAHMGIYQRSKRS